MVCRNNCKLIFLSFSKIYTAIEKTKIRENDYTSPETIYGINELAVAEKFIIEFSKYVKNLTG